MSKLELVISFIVGFVSSLIVICSTSGVHGNEMFKFFGIAFLFACIYTGCNRINTKIEELEKEIEELKNKDCKEELNEKQL